MIESPLSYDAIRPYHDEEIPEVLQRLSQKPSFALLMRYLFPEQSIRQIEAKFAAIRNVDEFQDQYIRHAVWRMLKDSAGEVTWEGFEQLQPGKKNVFLSNHRDIILDSAILNVLLKDAGFSTSKIAIGDNLLVSGLVTDLMKLNKSFIVHRDVARQDMLAYSQRLSAYIREQIVKGIDSVWVAQRNGRTKDGNDQTHTGLLKMLNVSGSGTPVENFRELNLIPMSISYEFDPCDGLKAEEMVHLHQGIPYQKDDKEGMIRGIRDPKGRIHLCLCTPLDKLMDQLPEPRNLNAWLRELADVIDHEIHLRYRLWPSNYVAADLLSGDSCYTHAYDGEDARRFQAHMETQLTGRKGDPALLRDQFLRIYATPVWNWEQQRKA